MDEQKKTETLGERLKRLMAAKGFTQSSLAKRAGIDRSEVNRIANDKKMPRPEELALLAQALETPVTELMADIELDGDVRKVVTYFEDAARRALIAEAARDEALARQRALEEELERSRQDWVAERQVLENVHAAAVRGLTERLAALEAQAKNAETARNAQSRAAAEEKAQLTFALQEYAVSDGALRQSVSQLQAALAQERSSKVATAVLTGLAGLLVGGMSNGGDAE